MRRFARTHVAALVLILVAAVPSAFANGTAQNTKFRIALTNFPEVVQAGTAMNGVLSIQNLTAQYQHADIQFFLSTPLGNGLIRSSSRDVAPNFSKSVRTSFPVSREARPGRYEMIIYVTNGNDTLTVVHQFQVE